MKHTIIMGLMLICTGVGLDIYYDEADTIDNHNPAALVCYITGLMCFFGAVSISHTNND